MLFPQYYSIMLKRKILFFASKIPKGCKDCNDNGKKIVCSFVCFFSAKVNNSIPKIMHIFSSK